MRRRILSLLYAGLLLAGSAGATNYYVSPTGNDAGNGTSTSTPWRTIGRLNLAQLAPGDQVLFQRGGTYRGEIIWGNTGTSTASVLYGAYGTGANPIISGSEPVTGWTQHNGSIYKAYVGTQVDRVYIGGSLVTLARTPNAGSWYRNSNGQGLSMTSSNITQPNGFFTGSRCILRSTASSVDTLFVTGHTGSTLTFGSGPMNWYMNQDDWGFYLENKLSLLDAPNEWFYDKSSGYLYLWAPGGVNPSTLTVEASVHWSGVNCHLGRSYAIIENLTFQHQRYAGILNQVADHVTVRYCTFQDLYHGIRTVGSYDVFTNNLFQRTYATAAFLLDSNTVFENNTLTDICLNMGMGETGWGYFGVRSSGVNNIIRGNRFTNIGYSPIIIDANHLVERNVIGTFSVLLNDGGAIAFDNTDGAVIRDNIIRDAVGGTDGNASAQIHSQPMGVGIYFGNRSNKNVTVQRNTISNVSQYGINVDHTMNSVNLKIKDNVIFNTGIGICVSDYSNATGPYAVPPYFVPGYNDEYSGNIVHCITKDQLCLKVFNCHGNPFVDFGTFTNNAYFNPYQEVSIFYHNTFNATTKYYSLETWRNARSEEQGSTRSPMHRAPYRTTSEQTPNLVAGGDFSSTNVGGWQSQAAPVNGQLSWSSSNLDNGSLKVLLPNISLGQRLAFRNPDWFGIVNGQWYRMRISIRSNTAGTLVWGMKAQSTLSDPYAVYEQLVAFDQERRDLELYFQNTITDNGQVRFISPGSYLQDGSDFNEADFYIDNIEVRKVTVEPVDPLTLHRIFVNDQPTDQVFTVPSGCWSAMDGTVSAGGSTFTLAPYASRIMYKVDDTQCATQPSTGTVGVKVFLGGAMDWANMRMRDDLRAAGLLPSAEPYTAMGYVLENPGATVSAAVLSSTGNTAPVDWVVVELKDPANGYAPVARRACLVRRDGTVIGPDGDAVITFTTATTVGRNLIISHRNHLGVMTAGPILSNGQVIDLTQISTPLYGTDGMQVSGGRMAMYGGNATSDILLKYVGSGNDRDPVLTVVGGTTPNNVVPGYRREDVNLDGLTKYTGPANDRDCILQWIGGNTPSNVRVQQVP